MAIWSPKTEEELAVLIKDWLKQIGRTQSDLRKSLQASSSRMPGLIDALKIEFKNGGMAQVAARLCSIEKDWKNNTETAPEMNSLDHDDPFGQLDLLLEDIRDNSLEDNSKRS